MPKERISVDPNICHGQACIKGTRIPVYQIVRMLANGDSIEDLLKEYPSITREDILACLENDRRQQIRDCRLGKNLSGLGLLSVVFSL